MAVRKTKIKEDVVEQEVVKKQPKTKQVNNVDISVPLEAVTEITVPLDETELVNDIPTEGLPTPCYLTDQDKGSIYYFISEKRDITLWKEFPTKKHLIEQELPYLWSAIKQLDQAERLINLELAQLGVF